MCGGGTYWYVLFVRTGYEEKVVVRLKSLLGIGYMPFIPQKTCVLRRQGKKTLFQKICFPGYVFIESDQSVVEFGKYVSPVIHKLQDAYRFLNYGDISDIAMHEEEQHALSSILGNNHEIDVSIGFKEGDSVRILSGALAGNESKIARINRGRHEAVISLQLFGSMVSVSIGLDIIEKAVDLQTYRECAYR